MTRRCAATACVSIVLLVSIADCKRDRPTGKPAARETGPAEAPAIALHYTIDARQPQSGQVAVTLIMHNLPAGAHTLIQGASNSETAIDQVVATDGQGRAIALATGGTAQRPTRRLSTGQLEEIRLHWVARPGGVSKHGKEGYLAQSFGLLDGGVYLFPEGEWRREKLDYSGLSRIKTVRVMVQAPEGWEVISDMVPTPDGLDPAVEGRWVFAHLESSNIALGHFDRFERTIGGIPVRLFVHRNWDPQKKASIVDKAARIFAVFQRQTPCTRLPAYTVIFLPAALDGGVVSGDFWSSGQAFSFDGYDERRVWELFAHRVSHGVNRYGVCGMHMEHPQERWFVEGWSSWVEVTHPLAAGVTGSEQRLIELGQRYRPVALGVDRRVRDRAIVEEAGDLPPDAIEHLHYVKAPLVVQQLDYEMRRLSGHSKSVNGFMRELHRRYGGHRGNVPLRKELDAYMGRSMRRFFEEHVEQPGFLYPVHKGFIEHVRAQKRGPAQQHIALRVDDETINARQIQQLQVLLGHLKITDARMVRETAIQMLLVMQEYRRRGLDRVPPEMIELAPKLPASVRYLIFLHQKRLLFGDDAVYRSWLQGRRTKARVAR